MSARGPSSPLYANEFSPPCHELVPLSFNFPEHFPPSGRSGPFFDDREFIKQCQIVHINEVCVYLEDYISGLEISYFLDGSLKLVKHLGTRSGKRIIFPLRTSDSIVKCVVTYEDACARSLRMETIEGQELDVVSALGRGGKDTVLDLKSDRRGVVAFKGRIGDYIEGLRVYSWRMVGKANR
jgi:hypothetical protein